MRGMAHVSQIGVWQARRCVVGAIAKMATLGRLQMTRGMNATLAAAVTAIALTTIAPAHADPISDVLRLSILGGSVVGAPTSITTFDTSIAGTVVETPGSLNVIGFLLN